MTSDAPNASRGPAIILALAFALPSALSAQGADDEPAPLIGDRPDFTESASVVGRLQLETGYTYEEAGPTELHTAGEMLVRIPASRRLELRVGVPSWAWSRIGHGPGAGSEADGVTEASLGVKVELREPSPDGGGPQVALLAGTTIPTGGDMGADGLHPGGRLAAVLELSDRLALAANAGVASAEDAGSRHAELAGSVSLGVGLAERLGAYLETFGLAPTGDGPGSSTVVNGGLTWLVGRDLQLDVRLGTGLSGPSPDLIFGAGLVWRAGSGS